MRIGLRGRRLPPQKAVGFVLIAVGAIVILLAMPAFVHAAILGGLIAYVGYTLIGR